LGKSPAEGYPNHPPPHRVENPRSLHVERTRFQDADAESGHGIGWDAEKRGGGNNAKLNNSSTVQHFDAIFQMKIDIPFFLLIALTKCSYLLLASLASNNCVLYSKGARASSQPSVDYTTFNRQHLCEERYIKNKVGHSNIHGTVSLCYFSH
jgi:hypothetical protein